MKKSAGLLIIQNNKILLGHPTNAAWNNTYSIPKGGVEKGESLIDTAIRETYEEVGLLFKKDDIKVDDNEYVIVYTNKKGKAYKKVYYYVINLKDNTLPEIIPKEQLQVEEIDWAGFLSKEEASNKIFWRFEKMLDFIY